MSFSSSKTLIKGSVLTVIFQMLSQLSLIVLNYVVSRYYDISDYGHYVYGFSLAIFFSTIASLGASTLLPKLYGSLYKDSKNIEQTIFKIMNWHLYIGLIITIITYCVTSMILSNEVAKISLALIFPLFFIGMIGAFYTAVKKVFLANLQMFILRTILLLFFVVLTYFVCTSLSLEIAIAFIFIFVFIYWVILSKDKSFGFEKPKDNIFFYSALSWVNIFQAYVSIFTIKYFLSSTDIALYSLAVQMYLSLNMVMLAVSSNLLSSTSYSYFNESVDVFRSRMRKVAKLIFIVSLITVILSIIGSIVLVYIYGESYYSSFYIYLILLIGFIFHIANGTNGNICVMTGNVKANMLAIFLSIFVNILVSILFISTIGVYSIALGAVMGIFTLNLLQTYICIKKIKVNPTIFSLLDIFIIK